MAQELIRLEDSEYTEIQDIEDEMVYTIRDENQQLIQVQREDVQVGQKYIVFPVVRGG